MAIAPPWRGSGYAQTKWVADQLARSAAAAGHDVRICRLGLVMGDCEQGRVQTAGYWATQVLRACARTGCVPAELDLPVNAIPVDLAARGIVARVLSDGAPTVTHLGGEERLTTQTLADALRELGFSITELPRDRWLERVRGAAADDGELGRLLSL